MKSPSILAVFLLVLLCAFAAPAQTKSATSAGDLQLGVDAYRDARYEEAAHHFENAIDLDGSNINARLYLATACTSQYVPGVDSAQNVSWADKAIDQYLHVLDSDAERRSKINSAKGVAYLYLNLKKFEDSRTYYQMASDFDPKDPEPYYSLGVIDWTICYQPRMEARSRLGISPEWNLNSKNAEQKKACDELSARNMSIVEDGIASLKKAIELRPDYDDAIAYLNLMYREKADLECDDPAARTEDLKTADDWVDKTLGVKKVKSETATIPVQQ